MLPLRQNRNTLDMCLQQRAAKKYAAEVVPLERVFGGSALTMAIVKIALTVLSVFKHLRYKDTTFRASCTLPAGKARICLQQCKLTGTKHFCPQQLHPLAYQLAPPTAKVADVAFAVIQGLRTSLNGRCHYVVNQSFERR